MHSYRFRTVGLASLCMCSASFAVAQNIDYDTARLGRTATAVRITGSISLDGALDEPEWGGVTPASGFTQWQPDSGAPASDRTEVRFLYDDDNLYIGFTAFEEDPDRLTVNEILDDFNFGQSDAVSIAIDSLNDDRSGFVFVANPAGGRRDGQVANDGAANNFDWDGVWEIQTARFDQGWTAEMAIPFKTLRFSNAPRQEWGVNMTRAIRRKNEESQWSPIPPRYRSTRVSLAGTLRGIENVRPGRNLKIKPFVIGGFNEFLVSPPDPANPFGLEADGDFDGGVDVKYGLTQSLTLDGTYRTDFAQVEVDQQQVNLTRFNLFFPEKREFFLENAGTFAFGSGDDSNLVPFFSRRIGLGGDGSPIPIVGGARVSGRAGRYDVGFLTMRTEAAAAAANTYTVGRVKRNLLTNSWIGGLVTHRDSSVAGDHNRVYGVDAHFQFYSRLEFDSHVLRSDTPSLENANLARKFSSAWRDDELIIAAAYEAVQANFRPEVGFIRRRDVGQYTGELAFNPLIESSPSIRNLTFGTTVEYFEDLTRDQIATRTHNVNLGVQFQNNASIAFTTSDTFDRLVETDSILGIALDIGDYRYRRYSASASTDPTERINGSASVDWGEFWGGHRTSFAGDIAVRPSHRVNFALDYSHNRLDLANGRKTTDLAGIRFVYAFSPRAFLNAFVQYNADTQEVSSNIRFNLIHRPLSDLFIVYNDRRDTDRGGLIDRALIVKFTNLFDF